MLQIIILDPWVEDRGSLPFLSRALSSPLDDDVPVIYQPSLLAAVFHLTAAVFPYHRLPSAGEEERNIDAL